MIKTFLRKVLILILIFLGQIQPLQVHALVFEAEQAGHIAGFLQHSHIVEHSHRKEAAPDVSHQHFHAEVDSHSSEHKSECHPAHISLVPEQVYSINKPFKHCWIRAKNIDWPSFISRKITPPPKAW